MARRRRDPQAQDGVRRHGLTTGFWPTYKFTELALPGSASDASPRLRSFTIRSCSTAS